jgi:small-conductance mechanosensitive channel
VTPVVVRHPVRFLPVLRAIRVAWRTLPHLAIAVVAVAGAWALDLSAEARRQVLVVSGFLLAYGLLRALASEVLSPLRPALRVLPLDDRAALRVQGAVRLLLALLFATETGRWLAVENRADPALAALLGAARDATLLLFAAVGIAASGVVGRLSARLGSGVVGTVGRTTLRVLLPLALLTALLWRALRALGWAPLASWVVENAARTGLQVLLIAVTYRTLRVALRRSLTLGSGGATVVEEPSPAAIGAERIAAGLLRIAFGIAGVLWVLSTWGLSPARIAGALDEPVFDGGGLVWGQPVGGLARVAFVLFAAWLLRDVLTFFVFPRARVDVGARYAVLAMLRYAVVVLVIFFALAGIGIETSSLAWFLGAAGVGLGIGLQDVLGNFFGGLVMLVERPIRVGDFVRVGDAAGTVEAIRIRGTLIRTPDNTTVLVPNRQMLGERVSNLSWGLSHRRLEVRVGVAYGSSPEHVRRVLLGVAQRHPSVVESPAPFVLLDAFGASSLDFILYAQARQPLEVFAVASDLRFEIFRRFEEEGIEIPFPRQDVRLLPEGRAAPKP